MRIFGGDSAHASVIRQELAMFRIRMGEPTLRHLWGEVQVVVSKGATVSRGHGVRLARRVLVR
jgi:hypothetical protein